tara:strand:- start:1074 stop:1481 length:408 start_codon:yes stop_codon:yes gene_type:complete
MNMASSISPTRSRDKVLQSLYEAEVGSNLLDEVISNRPNEKNNTFFQNLLRGVLKSLETLDKILEKNLPRPLSQLDPIERNILRMALFEILNKETKEVIVISEAIRLSKKYGSSNGYKFINAILDKLIKEGLDQN